MPDLDHNEKQKKLYRRKRVQRIKTIIVCFFILLVTIPSIICIASQMKIKRLEKSIEELNAMLDSKLYGEYEEYHQEMLAATSPAADDDSQGNSDDKDADSEKKDEDTKKDSKNTDKTGEEVENPKKVEGEKEQKVGKNQKRVYLTFDDGPSENSNEILDILKKNNIKATFFVIGKKGAGAEKIYKRIVNEGHTLAMHSYTHDYSRIYKNLDAFKKDVTDIQDYLYDVTGVRSLYYRFPGGSSNTISKVSIRKCIKWLKSKNIEYYDWNSMTGDASGNRYSPNTLVSNAMQDVERFQNAMVLMHDAKDKDNTVKALPKLIKKLKKEKCAILPIDSDTVPVQHIS